MDVGKFITAWVKQDAGVTAIIGSGTATRIYPVLAPQGAAYPRVTYQVIDSPGQQQLSGPASYYTPRVQVDCWTRDSYKVVQDLADAVEDMDGYRGTLGSVVVQGCHLVDRHDDYEPPGDASELGIYRVQLDFIIWHE